MKQGLPWLRRLFAVVALAAGAAQAATFPLPGLAGPVTVERDLLGQPIITASTESDSCYVLGFVHAQDRLFQMDFLRRVAQGTSATLLGSVSLPTDIQLRNLGVGRGAQASLNAMPADVLACLQAYSNGINALIAGAPALPPEYGALEISKAGIPAWTPLDSMAIAKLLAFQLGVSLVDIDRTIALLTLQGVGDTVGFDGVAAFFEEMWRIAPFEPVESIPDFFDADGFAKGATQASSAASQKQLIAQLKRVSKSIKENPFLAPTITDNSAEKGSNWFLASGSITQNGVPLFANDPHLDLGNAPVFYPIAGIDVTDVNNPSWASGVTFAGVPAMAQGCTTTFCWGSTVNRVDQTDVFSAKLQLVQGTPVGYEVDGQVRPLTLIPQAYEVNLIGDGVDDTIVDSGITPADPGGLTLVSADLGAAVDVDTSDPANVTGLFVRSPLGEPTAELVAFRHMATASNINEFQSALEYFDLGSQNWGYADLDGNIAYFTMAEIPIRNDLSQGSVTGLGPGFIRDGGDSSTHWSSVTNPQNNQSSSFEILPYDELPSEVNPPRGYIINANNDPVGVTFDNNPFNQVRRNGNGLYYISEGGFAGGYRQKRIVDRIHQILDGEDRLLTLDDFEAIQGDVIMRDAQVFVPHILNAFQNAQDPNAELPLRAMLLDNRVIEAVQRLAAWDFSTPTGIQEGFDFGDDPANLPVPSNAEIANSVAATIYSAWRGRVLDRTFNSIFNDLEAFAGIPGLAGDVLPNADLGLRGLRHLLENFEQTGGRTASNLWYFRGPVNNLEDGRDFVLLLAMQDALNDLAGPGFDSAFGGSTDQNDYRWGQLHRVIFEHPLGGVEPLLNVPAGASPDDDVLDGFSTDGGLFTVDRSDNNPAMSETNHGLFDAGPSRRFVGEFGLTNPGIPGQGEITAFQVLPGGVSGVPAPGNPFYANQLPLWLTNASFPLPTNKFPISGITAGAGDDFVPFVP